MRPRTRVLVVDDERHWREFYEEEARQLGVQLVDAATNLAEAEEALAATRFAVAVVDVGLDERNDRNIDGLLVMQKIRELEDQTSIIVVTGRSGRDVVPIVRDSIKKFGALDAAAKATLVPAELRKLIEVGIEAYEEATSDERKLVHDAVRGERPQVLWDDEMIGRGGISGGVVGLYAAIEGLFGNFVPLIFGRPKGMQLVDGVVCGVFWSRGIGKAIVGCLGEAKRIQHVMEEARSSGVLLGTYRVSDVAKEFKSSATSGVIYLLADSARADYGV